MTGVYRDRPQDEALVIPLRVSTKQRRRWIAISVVVPVGAVIAFVVIRSWEVGIWGAFTIGCFVLVWVGNWESRRATRGAPMELVVTTTGISSPLFALDWDRVRRIRLVYLRVSELPALVIDPIRPADVRRTGSRLLRLMARGPIRILQANVDLPLGRLAAELEARAGRPLLGQP